MASASKQGRSRYLFPLKVPRRKRQLHRSALAPNNLASFARSPAVADGERGRIATNLLDDAIGAAPKPPALDAKQENKKEKILVQEK